MSIDALAELQIERTTSVPQPGASHGGLHTSCDAFEIVNLVENNVALDGATATTNAGSVFEEILNSLAQQMAMIDAQGVIRWTNRAWKDFSRDNGGSINQTSDNANYLVCCVNSAKNGERDANNVLRGIHSVIRGEVPAFNFEYACHSPTEQRWFMMTVRPLSWQGSKYFAIIHLNITARKLAELKVAELAVLDDLTGIANRRRFSNFLDENWRRAQRLGHPVSMALLDIDFFKPFNDTYGHVAGDECLRRVGNALKPFARRPDDLVARYGGEEFAVIFCNTDQEAACHLIEKIRATIQELQIPHAYGTEVECVTVSAGVATLCPDIQSRVCPLDLVEAADQALYQAKERGRNRVCVQGETTHTL